MSLNEDPTPSIDALLGQVDIALVIDTTSSMGPYIAEARKQAQRVVQEIADKGDLDVRVAVVEYRDHPPQDPTFASRMVIPLIETEYLTDALNLLVPLGGGDIPEAVLDGLIEAASKLEWRQNADRLCFLIGDAEPHGYGNSPLSDGFPGGCPCKATPNGVVELLAGNRITLHSILLQKGEPAERAFRELAEGTNGTYTLVETAAEGTHAFAGTVSMSSEMVGHSRSYMMASAAIGSATPEDVAAYAGMTLEEATGTAAYMARRGIDVSASPGFTPVDSYHDGGFSVTPAYGVVLPEVDINADLRKKLYDLEAKAMGITPEMLGTPTPKSSEEILADLRNVVDKMAKDPHK